MECSPSPSSRRLLQQHPLAGSEYHQLTASSGNQYVETRRLLSVQVAFQAVIDRVVRTLRCLECLPHHHLTYL